MLARNKRILQTVGAVSLGAFLSLGCGDKSGINTGEVITPKAMANQSELDYNENQHGLVTATNVEKWIKDWENNRPEGINGKLIILQIGKISVDGNYTALKHDDVNIFTYELGDVCNTYYSRFDGVSKVAKAVNSGQNIDNMMMAYGIDPQNDMLLFVQGNGLRKGSNMSGAARMWYTFSYWGLEQEHMALLNGNASFVLNPDANSELESSSKDELFDQNLSSLPMSGTVSIKEIRRNATALQATMKDMRDLIDNCLYDSVIVDARTEAEYNGTKRAKTELKTCGQNRDEQCYTPFDGHIAGAKHLLYTNVLDLNKTADLNGDGNITATEASYTFKSVDEIQQLFNDLGYEDGKTLYTYCRTGTKSSLLAFSASQIAGYTTRMYDGSWIQWGRMAHREDANGSTLIPENSYWRNDVDKYSENITYNGDSSSVIPQDPADLNLCSCKTDKIVKEDKKYKSIK